MPLHVWIPAASLAVAREHVPGSIQLDAYPPGGGWPVEPQPADLLVATDLDAVLDALPHLDGPRVVQTLSAGVDWIAGRLPTGLTLCNGSGIHDIGVAEWVVMAILAVFRRLPALVNAQRAGTWAKGLDRAGAIAATGTVGPDDPSRGEELNGSTVLVLGYGSIGQALEARLRPFGAKVVRVARAAREGVHGFDQLPTLLPRADVVVVLVPLTTSTRGLVGATVFDRMKAGALLVNAARGGVVDTDALLGALHAGRIRAALDVTDPEPLPDGHPLWSAPNVLITPHIAGDVRGEQARAWAFVAEQVGRLERGEPLRNLVAEGY